MVSWSLETLPGGAGWLGEATSQDCTVGGRNKKFRFAPGLRRDQNKPRKCERHRRAHGTSHWLLLTECLLWVMVSGQIGHVYSQKNTPPTTQDHTKACSLGSANNILQYAGHASRQTLKSRDITLSTKVCMFKAKIFPVVTYGCES